MCAFISLLYLWLFFTYIPVHLFHLYMSDFKSHKSVFILSFSIPFPKIIPGEKCFAFIQGVWDLFFFSFEIQFAYNLLHFLSPKNTHYQVLLSHVYLQGYLFFFYLCNVQQVLYNTFLALQ